MFIDLMKMRNLIPSFEDEPQGGGGEGGEGGEGGDKPVLADEGGDKPEGDKPEGDKPVLADEGGDKPEGDKPEGDKPEGDKPVLADNAPVEYKFEQVDGKDVDEAVSKPIADFAKEHKLSQEQAQALLNRELEVTAQAERDAEAQEVALQKEWRDAANKDEVLNEGGKYEENVAVAKKGFKHAFPELAEIVNELPFLDNPLVLRGMLRIGRLISEDGDVVQGHKPAPSGDRANKFYPTMTKQG